MSVTLAGREVEYPVKSGKREVGQGACIFCGKRAVHVNDNFGAAKYDAWMCHYADGSGEVKHYLYHSRDCSGRGKAIVVWRCGCVSDYVENVGPVCCDCGRPRHAAVEYPCGGACPRCGCDLEGRDAREADVTFYCFDCGWIGDIGSI